MHIMEGFLPLPWAVFWTAVALPFIVYGIYAMRKLFAEHPEVKLTVALSGAFIVILSSLKIPSVTGSSSHPTGTGLSVMFSGPWITVVICTIVLLFQGTFMAHGGFTTLGANVFSMGIAGPFVAYGVFSVLRKKNFNVTATVFVTAFVANVVTYTVTALQLTLIIPYTDVPAFFGTYATFFGIFAVTQIPIAIAEGTVMVLFFKYLADVRPDIVKYIGFDSSVRHTKGILDNETKERSGRTPSALRSRLTLVGFAVAMAAMILVAYIALFFFDFQGADDAGSSSIFSFIPGYERLSENFIQLGEFGISILFIIQTIIGILIFAFALRLFLRTMSGKQKVNRGMHNNEFNSVDMAAYRSPMIRWSPLGKLLLVLSLLVLDIASPSVWMSVFACGVGITLFAYGSSLRPPRVLMYLFLYAMVFIVISAVIFTVVIPGDTAFSLSFFGLTINFTDAGLSFGTLIFLRATAAVLLMFAFAVSTPVPHLAAALKKLRLPDVFIEMMVLIYRYTFLLMESAESMHLAAECKFGYSSYKKSAKTTSRIAVGVFIRSLDTAEKGQIALQCRNYRGEFKSLSVLENKNTTATVLCASVVCAALIIFFALRLGVLPI